MPRTGRCKHEMPEGTCVTCRPPARRPPAPREQPRYGRWFTAGYDSECDGCSGLIMEGDQIRSDGEGGWLCPACGED